ncbi:CopM family metallochaperone [Mangrovicella endophytica]|uniref:CopM family metallochaperone n=1 Tax=Mangrovicella endophytica TaxID=2066697 RepID=UPI000C9E4939|nr:DUF305 domain-containing protein [Mangrovicella endophytica]
MRTMFATAALVLLVLPAAAQTMDGMDHGAMHGEAGAPAAGEPKTLEDASAKMHQEMGSMPMTGDVDVDFMQGMIAHHRGAIDMAKIALRDGKDPEIKALAKTIVEAQEGEIKMMQDWLAKHRK